MRRPYIVNRLSISEGIRKERVINPIDGIDDIVKYEDIEEISLVFEREIINNNIDLSTVDFLIGLDSGGFLPTFGLSALTKIPFKLAWKINLDIEQKFIINEPYAVGKDIYIYNLPTSRNVIIVDDEITTGKSILNLFNVLQSQNINVLAVLVITEITDFNAKEAVESQMRCPLISHFKMRINELEEKNGEA